MSAPAVRAVHPRRWLLWGTFLTAGLLLKPVQDRVGRYLEPSLSRADILYFGAPDAIRKMALGYDSLLADIYWMRTIQYYGRREEAARRPVRYRNLAALLDITATLDPEMLDVYHAGSVFLAEPDPVGAGQPEQAVRLLEKGIEGHPDNWRLMQDKGFVYFWYFQDYRRAGEAWLAASRLESAPHWMQGLAAMALSRGGEIDTAKQLWQRQLEQSGRDDVRNNARNHLASLEVSETLWTFEFFIGRYRAAHGKLPGRLDDLVRAGYLRSIPPDPSGIPYDYEPFSGYISLSPNTRVRQLPVPPEYRNSFMSRLARIAGIR
jgi:tetratricopeptide (TPR) repeat protein